MDNIPIAFIGNLVNRISLAGTYNEFKSVSVSVSAINRLLDMAADKFLLGSVCTRDSMRILPINIFHKLMILAIRKKSIKALGLLVETWPFETLRLSDFAPPLFDSTALYDTEVEYDSWRRGIEFTQVFSTVFLENLTRLNNLRHLNLSGYPTGKSRQEI